MTPKRVILVRHGDDPPDDRVFTYLTTRGFAPEIRCPYRGDSVTDPDESIAGSVVFGGPFSVFETNQNPFLLDEHRWIEQCMERGIPLLGICQGAQSIAHVLGARVGPPETGMHEFGYYEIVPTEQGRDFLPEPIHVVQAHYHQFAVPSGGELLAESALFPHQAFRYGKTTYGMQFHPEVTIEAFRRWQTASWAAYGQPGAQTRDQQDALMLEHDAAQASWFYGFLESLFGSRTPNADPLLPTV